MPPRLRCLLALLGLLALVGCSAASSRAQAFGARPGAGVGAAPAPRVSASAGSAVRRQPLVTTAAAALAFSACASGGDGAQCASLPVPLDAGRPSGGTLHLAVLRIPARVPSRRLGVLVVNPGGPGASAVDYLRAAVRDLPEVVRDRFDLVAFDPRGVGRSGAVHCQSTAQLDAYFHLDPTPDTPAALSAYEAANRAFAQGCARRSGSLLAHVSTVDAADDMERLRLALHESRLNYLGYSYGTSIGATYLDRYPTHLRAAVLDGAIDPSLTWEGVLEGQAGGFDVALRSFLADCQRRTCAFRRAVTGDLGAAFDALSARVDRHPLAGDGPRVVGPGEFAFGTSGALYDTGSWPDLADALARAERGQGDRLLALSDAYLGRTSAGYTTELEANAAVNCVDRPWPRDPAPYLALGRRLAAADPRFGQDIALSGLSCASWPVPPSDTPHRVSAPGSPQVLVVGTTRDPATPFVWAQALAAQLSRGVLVTHDGDGHTAFHLSGSPCVVQAVDAYLLGGRASATRCGS